MVMEEKKGRERNGKKKKGEFRVVRYCTVFSFIVLLYCESYIVL